MRVVTGEAKGRKLKGPKTSGTRPIIDRVKTALFDILSTRVEDARFLDLFAGVGSVGIEALSRGAAHATFIEMNYSVLKLVRENLQITGLADRAETLHADAFKFLQARTLDVGARVPARGTPTIHDGPGERSAHSIVGVPLAGTLGGAMGTLGDGARLQYDIIYVAPPQYREMAARALALLDTSPIVPVGGLVIIQIHPKERTVVAAVPLKRLHLTDERRYGSTLLMFYEGIAGTQLVTPDATVHEEEQSTNVDTTTEA